MKKIIIDTDPGQDDALAIMLAVKSEMFDIKAITTVAGNSGIENTTRNARYILKLLGREDIPLYSGENKPLKRELVTANVHGESGLAGIDPKNEPRLTGNAVEKIIELVNENPGIIIVSLGPLTNLAKAILGAPEIVDKIGQFLIMGGAITVPGNKSRVAEFNMYVDPEAAEIVFNSSVKKTIVPLDVCNVIPVSYEEFEKISNSKIKEPVLAMMKPYIENIYFYDEGIRAALMYDPLTIYFLMKSENCRAGMYDIKIETEGKLTSGMTVIERRNRAKKVNNVEVVEFIDARAFKKDFIEVLSKQ